MPDDSYSRTIIFLMKFRMRLLFAVLFIGAVSPVFAQALKLPLSTTVEADRIDGVNEESVMATGSVHLRRDDVDLFADQVRYRIPENEVEADGNIRLKSENYRIEGPRLRLRLDEHFGFVDYPEYFFKGDENSRSLFGSVNSAHGTASRISIEGEKQYHMKDATFTTCEPGDDAWFARFSQLDFDYDNEVGEGWGAKVIFKGVPIFYSPYITFPLSRKRRSGFLAPTLGNTTLSGLEVTVPYYLNIAPSMDATLFPRYFSKRGVQLGNELRYLGDGFNGELFGEILPDDRLVQRNRWASRWQHQHHFGYGISGSVDVSRVSDDFYYKDLASQITVSAQTQLAQQVGLSFSRNGWSVAARALRFQTLQPDPLVPVSRPYELMPQLTVDGRSLLMTNLEASLAVEDTDFRHPDPGHLEARRTVIYPKITLPFVRPGYYLKPKFGMHMTRYAFGQPVAGLGERFDRRVPIVSVDSGLVFERQIEGFGRKQVQTLEPRLYYLWVPYRDQSDLAAAGVNFDTGVVDFNFAQIFAENPFSGHDRIADANQATLALTSRLLDETGGQEYFRAMLGQRFYFREQGVTLNLADAPRTEKKTDILGAVTGELLPNTFVDAAAQYNPSGSRFERFNTAVRFQPAAQRVLNVAYRFSRLQTAPFDIDVRNIDVSGQWPILGRWQAVGRYNYSLKEDRVIESLGGVEYFSGCWSTRLVVQQFATSTSEYKTAIFLQLELTDFGKLGTNPMDAISRGIPGYSRSAPAR